MASEDTRAEALLREALEWVRGCPQEAADTLRCEIESYFASPPERVRGWVPPNTWDEIKGGVGGGSIRGARGVLGEDAFPVTVLREGGDDE